MALSAGTFYHFTSFINLMRILDCQYFQVNYSRERITLRQTTIQPYIPMVCFCDIPLTQTGEHIKKYDGFAIGLSKEWGIGHGLNPVFYVSPIGFTVTLENLSSSLVNGDFAKGAFEHIFSFMKPYEELVEQKKLLYYDEREWRFVPYVRQFQDKVVSQIYWDSGLSEAELKHITGHRFFKLDFKISDIKYLITKSNNEKSDLISYLQSTKYSESMMNQSFRILSIDEVYNDF